MQETRVKRITEVKVEVGCASPESIPDGTKAMEVDVWWPGECVMHACLGMRDAEGKPSAKLTLAASDDYAALGLAEALTELSREIVRKYAKRQREREEKAKALGGTERLRLVMEATAKYVGLSSKELEE